MTDQPDPEKDGIDLNQLIWDCRRLIRAPHAMRRRMEEHGVMIIPANFYSSVPLITDLENTFEGPEENPRPVYDKIFRLSEIRKFIGHMTPFSAEFNPPESGDPENCREFFWRNSQFSYTDAMAYYCTVRHLRPRRIVEIGSGFSTLVAAAAIRKNGFGEIICIEPHPRPFLEHIESVAEIVRRPVQTIAVKEFSELIGTADVLFIDSTHTVKIGSDCVYIYLVLLPSISKPLMVHSHDICLPFGMSINWARDLQIYWTEQYLLYAYLLNNSSARVVFGSSYAAHFLRAETDCLMGGKALTGGGSLWYQINTEGREYAIGGERLRRFIARLRRSRRE